MTDTIEPPAAGLTQSGETKHADKAPNLALASVRAALNKSPTAAELALTLIGDEEGDEMLELAIRDLEPIEIMSIVATGDVTKPSSAVMHLTPAQFIEALRRFGGRWGRIGPNSRPRALLIDLEEFLCQIITTQHTEPRKEEMIKALMNFHLGTDIMSAFILNSYSAVTELETQFVQNPDNSYNAGTWQELWYLISIYTPSYRTEVMLAVESARADAPIETDEDKEEDGANSVQEFDTDAERQEEEGKNGFAEHSVSESGYAVLRSLNDEARELQRAARGKTKPRDTNAFEGI